MKLRDHVLKAIWDHPSLFLFPTYRDSKLAVMDHLFLTLGNGMEWAETKRPEDGGYMVEPRYSKKRNDDDSWTRLPDKPYGVEKFNRPWPEMVQHGLAKEKRDSARYMRKFLKDSPTLRKYMLQEKRQESLFQERKRLRKEYGERHPYPFSVAYWPLAEIDPKLIKPDWRAGMIETFEYALRFFEDRTAYDADRYYGDPSGEQLKEYIEKYHPKDSWEKVLKDYEFEGADIQPRDYKTLAVRRGERSRQRRIKELNNAISTLKAIAK